jgi:cytochrome P450
MPDGGWVVSSYRDAMGVISDPELYSSRVRRGAHEEPELIPLDIDPPLLLEYRRLLQPSLSLKAVATFEPLAREIITRLIDGVIESGRIEDFVSQVAQPFSSEVQWGWLVGVNEYDRAQALRWMRVWTYDHFGPEYDEVERDWVAWTRKLIADRRAGEPRDDFLGDLLEGQVQGRPLTDDEVAGIMMIMIVGGVNTTADAMSNIVLRLAAYPELQEQLREDIQLVPHAIEEFLRLDPPALGPSRRCTRDTELGGQTIKEGEQVFVNFAAANRDPEVFANPLEVEIPRERNAHLSFGAGHHRCLGATFARQNLRVVFEEILVRMRNIRVPDGAHPHRHPAIVWGLSELPVEFDPGPRRSA